MPRKPDVPVTDLSPKAQKRIAIAQDVLALLKAKRLQTRKGVYNVFHDVPVDLAGKSLQEHLKVLVTPKKPCEVCALGALFLGAVDLYNQADIPQPEESFSSVREETLALYFTRKELETIEGAFEGWDYWGCMSFYKAHPNPTERLQAICLNMIENNGEFKLPGAQV